MTTAYLGKNFVLIKLSLGVSEAASSAIKCVKTMASANIQNKNNTANCRDQTIPELQV